MDTTSFDQEVEDVDIGEALNENGSGEGQPIRPRPQPSQEIPEAEEPPEAAEARRIREKAEIDLEALAPKAGAREWTFGQAEIKRSYVQSELLGIGKAQWFGLVGEFVEKALGGPNARSINSLLGAPSPRQPGQYTVRDFQEADTFVQAVAKLLMYSPEFLEKSVCIWLSVPDYEWELVRAIMMDSPDIGGMSDQMFEDIFATFIDQNYAAIY